MVESEILANMGLNVQIAAEIEYPSWAAYKDPGGHRRDGFMLFLHETNINPSQGFRERLQNAITT